ncbi:MAG TPA: substrate-binding domain-containing protein [Herpetosiphonaceae bacterium]|nr:substrate-binding domain-containing protein [Herpetosiphonaceae bacterium]
MHIGYATQNPSSHYWVIVNHGVQERAAELGIRVTAIPAYSVDQQIAAINTLIGQRIDALLVGPLVANGLGGAISRAKAAGIPVVVLAAQVNDAPVACTVRSDHTKGAALAAAHVVERLEGVGKVAHLIGPTVLQDNLDRAAGVRGVFDQHPGIEVVYEWESPDWDPESGAAFMRKVLELAPDVAGVCVANDTLALGAVEAIAAAGRIGDIVVTGFDAVPDAMISIYERRLSASIHQSTRQIGRIGVELAQQLARGATVPPLVLSDVSLVTRANLVEEMLESAYLLPTVLRDVVERSEELINAREEIIRAQKEALRELSTPLIPISDSVTIMPLIGTIDTSRAQQIIETLLHGVSSQRTRTAILDITGVLLVDTQVANVLIQAAQAARLLGAEVVLTGIRPEVSQTLVGLGVNLGGIVTRGTLQSGIAYAMDRR